MLACAIFVLASVPLSFWVILERWPELNSIHNLLFDAHEKTDLHPLRIVHFLALTYLVVSIVEPWRPRLGRGIGSMFTLIGQQSLATFLASVVLARFGATLAELAGGSEFVVAVINVAAFAALYLVARTIRWFKRTPWKMPSPSLEPKDRTDSIQRGVDCPQCLLMRCAN
jgi:hypothetical protein